MKNIRLALSLLLLFELSAVADISRVEAFHNQKKHHSLAYYPRDYSHRGLHRIRPYHDRYRYRDRVYPRRGCDRRYRFVSDPLYHDRYRYRVGSYIERLPLGASAVIIDDVRYYRYGNHYFLPQRRAGVRLYLVLDL